MGTHHELTVQTNGRQSKVDGKGAELIGLYTSGGYLFEVGIEQLQVHPFALYHLGTVFSFIIYNSFQVNGLTRAINASVGEERKFVAIIGQGS